MVHNETIGAERRVHDGPSRAAIAGLAGIIGGLAMIPLSMLSDTTFGPEGSLGFTVFNLGIAVLFLLLATAVAGAYVRFVDELGTVRKAVAAVYALDLGLLGALMVTYALDVEPAFVADVVWIGMFVLGSLFGLALWGTSTRRRTAALFAAVFPVVLGGMIVVETMFPALADLAVVGLIFGLPLGLAFVSVGLDLRSTKTETVAVDGVSTA